MSENPLQWTCTADFQGQRIDKFLSEQLGESRSKIQSWISLECFTLNGKPAKKRSVLVEGDLILQIKQIEEEPSELIPENIPIHIVYEDEELVVVDKPKNLVVHPGNGNYTGTLANGLAYHFKNLSNINGSHRPGIVHRLDKDTSGLVVVAKNDSVHNFLAQQLMDRTMSRKYQALVWNSYNTLEGTYDFPIDRHPKNPLKKSVQSSGKNAVTHF